MKKEGKYKNIALMQLGLHGDFFNYVIDRTDCRNDLSLYDFFSLERESLKNVFSHNTLFVCLFVCLFVSVIFLLVSFIGNVL